MFVPSRRLVVIVLAASLVPWLTGTSNAWLLVALNLLLAGLAAADWWAAPRLDDVQIERLLPGDVVVNYSARLGWLVTNRGHARLRMRFADELASSLRGERRFVVSIEAGESAEVQTQIRPHRRGAYHLSKLVCRTRGPAGLASRQFTIVQPEVIRVVPAFRSRKLVEQRLKRTQAIQMGRRTARVRGSGTEFEQLREYAPDDDIRRVDWAATARSGRPIVREFRTEQNQQVMCLLDNGRLMSPRVADVTRLEHAMDAALAITTIATSMGDRAGLVAFDQEIRVTVAPSRRPSQIDRVASEIFDLEPVLAESHYPLAFNYMSSHFRRRSLLVLLTDIVPAAIEVSLLPALPLLRRRHVVMVGTVADPEVLELAGQSVNSPGDVHARAAASRVMARRRRSIRQLELAGAVVVDRPPQDLAEALVDAYLDIKASSRL
ncbi:MAG: DUF58 domain-containing protein [Acidimicrobiales bacterium]